MDQTEGVPPMPPLLPAGHTNRVREINPNRLSSERCTIFSSEATL